MTPPGRALGLILILLLPPALAAAQSDDLSKLLRDAADEVGYLNFEGGYERFSQALTKAAPGSDAWQQALFGKALCAHHLSPPTEARIKEAQRLYQELVDKAPDSRFAPRARLSIGRIVEMDDLYTGDKMDLVGARPHYQDVLDRFPSHPIVGEATLRLAATYIQTMQPAEVKKGIALLEAFLARHPAHELASTMWHYLGDTYHYPLDQWPQSLECYIKAEAIGFTEKGREGPVLWKMSVMAERLMHKAREARQDAEAARYRELAVKYFTKVITRAPNSGKGWESQQRLQAMGAPVPPIRLIAASQPGAASRPAAPPAREEARP